MTVPLQLEPMLAQAGEPFDHPDWLFEIKWDGTRCLAIHDGDRFSLQNRRFLEMRDRYPELAVLAELPRGTVLDGEVVVLEDGKPNFSKLQQRESLADPWKIQVAQRQLPATFVVFDQLFADGVSVMNEPLTRRRDLMGPLVTQLGSAHVMASEAIVGNGCAMFAQIQKHGLEGIMGKRLASRYQPGKRSEDWQKIKVAQVGEYHVLGFVQREGEPVVSALILGEARGSRWTYKGKVGSGFTEGMRAELYQELSVLPPLKHPPADGPADAQWHEAPRRCRIRFFEKTPTGKLRSPVFVAWSE